MDKKKVVSMAVCLLMLAGLVVGVESKGTVDGSKTEAVSLLSGFVVAHVFDDTARIHRLGLLYPVVEIPEGQTVLVNASNEGGLLIVDTVLRIHFDTHLTENMRFLLGRHLRVAVSLRRPDASFFERFAGDRMNLYRVDALVENGSAFIDVPFHFSTKNRDERIELRMLVVGNILGIVLRSHPVFVRSEIIFDCNIGGMNDNDDVVPPVTTIFFEGNEIR